MTAADGVQASSDGRSDTQVPSGSAGELDKSEEEEEDEELAAFDVKLAQASKTKPMNADTDAASDASSMGEDMDAEQMETPGEHIANTSKENKTVVSKKKQKIYDRGMSLASDPEDPQLRSEISLTPNAGTQYSLTEVTMA
ncbi:MAG: hypothetical protein Q9166_005210 [cf. Caloplaca sp. 2 TL-2023]